jgi:hypothetical protein
MQKPKLIPKHACLLVLLAAAVLGLSWIGTATTQSPPRYRSIRIEPFRVPINPVTFEPHNQPEVDLRPHIASMGITIRDQGNRGTCSVFAMTFLLEYAYGNHYGYRTPDFSEEYLNDVKNLATGDDWDGGFFTRYRQGIPTIRHCRRLARSLQEHLQSHRKGQAGVAGQGREHQAPVECCVHQELGR